MIRAKIKKLLQEIIGLEAKVEYPSDPRHGDYSTNVAMVAKIEPQRIVAKLEASPMFEKVQSVEPGFINFYLAKEFLQKELGKIKILNIGKAKKVQIEFISANPTGPLTMGNGRGAFIGDCLANVLRVSGYKIQREYYINDRGTQIETLKKGLYPGEARTWQEIQKANQKFITKKLKIKFNKWFREQWLYDSKQVEKALEILDKKELTYKKEGAIWLKTTEFGDDKDRVLVRKNGEPAYLLSDIAYFKNKMDRGYSKVINLWGADHYGYVARFKAMVKALGYRENVWDVLIMQLVRLIKDGRDFKMSKRKGAFVTLEWLVREVGLDAARFFFLMRSSDTHLNFDLDLAKAKSEKNPVYYVQYAHARICSILKKSKSQISNAKSMSNVPEGPPTNFWWGAYGAGKCQNLNLLTHPSELALMKALIKFPEIIEDIARDYQTQRLPQYSLDLATTFHKFYEHCQVLSGDKDLSRARLSLLLITKNILKQTLDLMGISAPERM